MRVIGGSARGRILKTPVGQEIRPTSDKVRLAIFNALFSRGGVTGKTVLDVFCGTGALGCEALSQGADRAVFNDFAHTSLALAKDNVAMLGWTSRAQFLQRDGIKIGVRPPSIPLCDIIFLDPPYRQGLILPTLEALKSGGWCAEEAVFVIETESEALPFLEYGELIFNKIYGETRVIFVKNSFGNF